MITGFSEIIIIYIITQLKIMIILLRACCEEFDDAPIAYSPYLIKCSSVWIGTERKESRPLAGCLSESAVRFRCRPW